MSSFRDIFGTNEGTDKRTNEGTDERTNEGTALKSQDPSAKVGVQMWQGTIAN